MVPLLSILTPAVPSRLEQLQRLCHEISTQIGDRGVEHLVFLDNKRRTIGLKRDALLRAARGQYIAYLDDDDTVSEDYVTQILAQIVHAPDVVTFRQIATIDGKVGEIIFRLRSDNEPFAPGQVIQRAAWHVCAWRRAIAVQSRFPDTSYGEDWAFACALNQIARTERHIDHILHHYHHSSVTTEAPPPSVDTPDAR